VDAARAAGAPPPSQIALAREDSFAQPANLTPATQALSESGSPIREFGKRALAGAPRSPHCSSQISLDSSDQFPSPGRRYRVVSAGATRFDSAYAQNGPKDGAALRDITWSGVSGNHRAPSLRVLTWGCSMPSDNFAGVPRVQLQLRPAFRTVVALAACTKRRSAATARTPGATRSRHSLLWPCCALAGRRLSASGLS
jgi:hypothetical protein